MKAPEGEQRVLFISIKEIAGKNELYFSVQKKVKSKMVQYQAPNGSIVWWRFKDPPLQNITRVALTFDFHVFILYTFNFEK